MFKRRTVAVEAIDPLNETLKPIVIGEVDQ